MNASGRASAGARREPQRFFGRRADFARALPKGAAPLCAGRPVGRGADILNR